MPTDPNELMKLAAQVNGLHGKDLKPWHIKATYQTFDAEGGPKDQGTFEKWWASPQRSKTSFVSGGWSYTSYATDKGVVEVGSPKWPTLPEAMLAGVLLDPLPSAITEQTFAADPVSFGGVSLECVRPTGQEPRGGWRAVQSIYCFSREIPAIRMRASQANELVTFNDIIRLQGRYVARQIRITSDKRPLLNIDVPVIEPPAHIPEAELTPPAGAVHPDQPISLPNKAIEAMRLPFSPPPYPMMAAAQRLNGTVLVEVVIDKKGFVSKAAVISGPQLFQQSALDEVKSWRFRPYLVKGEPADVTAQMLVNFHRY
jgi:TonB family protein